MEDERVKRRLDAVVALLTKLKQSGDLAGLKIEPDEQTSELTGGVAIRLMRGSEQIAMALIAPARAISPSDEVLVGDEAARDLASRVGAEFITAEVFAGLLARLVVTRMIPTNERNALAEASQAKAVQLKAYFQQQMAGFAVDVRQTDSDFDTMLTSFFFHKEGTQPIGWLWCIKVPNSLLADLETSKIIEHLEHHHWKERVQEAPAGTIFIATAHGIDVWNSKAAPNPFEGSQKGDRSLHKRGMILLGILNLVFPGAALFWRKRVRQGICYMYAFGILNVFRHDIGLLWALFVYVTAQVHFYKVARPATSVLPLGRAAKIIVWILTVGLWALYTLSRGVGWTNGGVIVHPLLVYILVTAAILTPAIMLTFWLGTRATIG